VTVFLDDVDVDRAKGNAVQQFSSLSENIGEM
jgi:hypothetical protein